MCGKDKKITPLDWRPASADEKIPRETFAARMALLSETDARRAGKHSNKAMFPDAETEKTLQ